MSDNITLPREVVQEALEAFEAVRPFSTTQRELKIRAVEALRTHLAAEQPKQEDIEALRRDAEALKLMRGCFDAAECEGWTAAIENGDIDRIRDLWQRRISHGLAAIDAVMKEDKK